MIDCFKKQSHYVSELVQASLRIWSPVFGFLYYIRVDQEDFCFCFIKNPAFKMVYPLCVSLPEYIVLWWHSL
ncbi:hypothetical protein PRUPE_6G310700 [Prunus persica]|uniref:Uncharacterized protein n=1 Tax=Prunus persica TaxID=3760 RepID=A0A251NY66_PRUPE|nr:hypothetical protein PRUPE_6G310700 [Prunus persica]